VIKLKNILAEQGVSKSTKPSTSKKPVSTTPITVNLYSDSANTKRFDTGKISNWPGDKLKNGKEYEFIVKTNNHGDVILRWSGQLPMRFKHVDAMNGIEKGTYYNKNLTKNLLQKYSKPNYNPNATFAQSSEPTDNTDAMNNFA